MAGCLAGHRQGASFKAPTCNITRTQIKHRHTDYVGPLQSSACSFLLSQQLAIQASGPWH